MAETVPLMAMNIDFAHPLFIHNIPLSNEHLIDKKWIPDVAIQLVELMVGKWDNKSVDTEYIGVERIRSFILKRIF